MNNELRRCPNCGAYVMSSDDQCPRCDFVLREPDAPAPDVAQPEHLPLERPGSIAPPTAMYDVSDLRAAQQEPALPAPDTDLSALPPTQSDVVEPIAAPQEDAPPLESPGPIAPPTAIYDLRELTPLVPEAEPEAADAGAQVPPTDQINLADLLAGRDVGTPEPPPATVFVPGEELAEPGAEGAGRWDQDVLPIGPPPEALPTPSRVPLPEVEPLFYTRKSAPRPPAPREIVPPPPQEMPEPVPDFAEPPPAITEGPTIPVESARPLSAMHATLPAAEPRPTLPPAPYTPPPQPALQAPARMLPPAPSYLPPGSIQPAPPRGAEAGIAYVQQRLAAYRQGGYRVLTHSQYEASLSCGKRMGVGTWILALVTGIGFLWYLLILAVSGFQRDVVTIVLENDGRVYEDGPGAAHVRGDRARAGRRWSAIGMLALFMGVLAAVLLGVIGGAVLSQSRFQAALREAYPAVTLFEERFSTADANPDDVPLMRDGAIIYAIAALVALVLVWGGATLVVIGIVHAAAYSVRVPPLPRWA